MRIIAEFLTEDPATGDEIVLCEIGPIDVKMIYDAGTRVSFELSTGRWRSIEGSQIGNFTATRIREAS